MSRRKLDPRVTPGPDDARRQLAECLRRMAHAAEAANPGTSRDVPWFFALAGSLAQPVTVRDREYYGLLAGAFWGIDESDTYTYAMKVQSTTTGRGRT